MASFYEKRAANTGVPPNTDQNFASPGGEYGLGVKPRFEGGGWPPSTNSISSTLSPIGGEKMPGEKLDQSPYAVQPSGNLADAKGAREALSQYQKTPQSPVQDIPQQIPPQSPVQGMPQQTAMQQALPMMKTTIAADSATPSLMDKLKALRAELATDTVEKLKSFGPKKSYSPRKPGWFSNVSSSRRNISEGLRHGFDVVATPTANKLIPGLGGAALGGLGGLAASEGEDEEGDRFHKNLMLKVLLGAGAGAGLGVAGASGYVKPKSGPFGWAGTQHFKVGADMKKSDITESKLRNLVAKHAAQDNNANSRSAVGESGGLTYKTNEEDHATGAAAWESLGKYMKTAGDCEATGLTPYQLTFAIRVHQANLSPQQIRDGIDKAAEYMGEEYVEELREGMDKIASMDKDAFLTALSRAGQVGLKHAPKIQRGATTALNWVKNLVGRGSKVAPKVDEVLKLPAPGKHAVPKPTQQTWKVDPTGNVTAPSRALAVIPGQAAKLTPKGKFQAVAEGVSKAYGRFGKPIAEKLGPAATVAGPAGIGGYTGHVATGQGDTAMPWYVKYPAILGGAATGGRMKHLTPLARAGATRAAWGGGGGTFLDEAAALGGIDTGGRGAQAGVFGGLLGSVPVKGVAAIRKGLASKLPEAGLGSMKSLKNTTMYGGVGVVAADALVTNKANQMMEEMGPELAQQEMNNFFEANPRVLEAMEMANTPGVIEAAQGALEGGQAAAGMMGSLANIGNMIDPLLNLFDPSGKLSESMNPMMKILLMAGGLTGLGGILSGSKGATAGGLGMMSIPIIQQLMAKKKQGVIGEAPEGSANAQQLTGEEQSRFTAQEKEYFDSLPQAQQEAFNAMSPEQQNKVIADKRSEMEKAQGKPQE